MNEAAMTTVELESLAVIALWMAPFVLGARLRLGATIGRRTWISVAAGISITYVFMDLLPEMGRMQELFSSVAEDMPLPLPDLRVYTAAMIGFIVFYILENMVVFSRADGPGEEKEHRPGTYWLHIFGFTVYCALTGYLLHEEARQNAFALGLYSLALFVHFWILDHSLRSEHGATYDRSGRWVIAGGIVLGWAIGLLDLSDDFVLPTLLGFIGGGVVINSLKEELPGKGEGRPLPFVLGAFGYAVLILLIELNGTPNAG